MDRARLTLSLAAVLAALCLYYRGSFLLLPILVLPVAAHELSHLLALRLLGLRVTGFCLEPRGLCIRYDGVCGPAAQIAAALAGPLGGALFALAAGETGVKWLEQSAGLSLLLTAFNLLPIPPLDGGRAFAVLSARSLGEVRGDRLCRAVSGTLLAIFLAAGVALALWKKASAPLAAGIWLLLFQNEEEALVKNGEII